MARNGKYYWCNGLNISKPTFLYLEAKTSPINTKDLHSFLETFLAAEINIRDTKKFLRFAVEEGYIGCVEGETDKAPKLYYLIQNPLK